MKIFKRILSFVPVISFLAVIYYFSAQPADTSTGLSTGVTYDFLHILNRIFSLNLTEAQYLFSSRAIEYPIRKIAHFSEYFLLFWFFMLPFFSFRVPKKVSFPISFVLCVLSAAADEYHQSFVSGRSPQVSDVILDSCGALTGLIVLFLFVCLIAGIRTTVKGR